MVDKMKFYNREKELAALRRMSPGSFLVIYGRRRVGKTALVRKAFPNALYFFVEKKSSELLLSEFSSIARRWRYVPTFIAWSEFFRYLFENYEGVLVFDEFQNFIHVDPSVFSTIQRFWDETKKCTLVVVGSYVGMIKRIFMDAKEPLYGRATAMLNLKPLRFNAVCAILSDLGITSFVDAVEIYSLFGGIPYYYELMEKYCVRKFEDCVKSLVLDVVAPLKYDIRNILIAELGKKYATYFSVLEAISMGKCSLKEISDITGIEMKSLSKYLHELCEVYNIVERRVPYGRDKRGRYFIKDAFTTFWFRFVGKNMSNVEAGNIQPVMEDIQKYKAQHVAKFFEMIVAEILQNMGYELHHWWHSGEEIDLLAINRKKREALFVEVKWQNRKVSWKIYEDLMRKADLVKLPKNYSKKYLVVSKTGFTKNCKELMESEGVMGWDLRKVEQMVKAKKS